MLLRSTAVTRASAGEEKAPGWSEVRPQKPRCRPVVEAGQAAQLMSTPLLVSQHPHEEEAEDAETSSSNKGNTKGMDVNHLVPC